MKTGSRRMTTVVSVLVCLLVAAGCAKTQVSRQPVATGQLPRPATVWVYDFAVTPSDLPADSDLAGQMPADAASQTAERIALGRKLGALMATELVNQIREMGLSAQHAVAGMQTPLNDLVIRGCIVSFDEGDAKKRVGIGLGKGESELKAAAEGFQMTAQGLRKLGSSATDAGGSKTPGAAVGALMFVATKNPVGLIVGTGMKVHGEKTGSSKVEGRATQTAKEIAEVLKERFKEQGWVN